MTSLSAEKSSENGDAFLDLFSTSPTNAFQERQASLYPCTYNAPYFAYKNDTGAWHVKQGNCHHWDCPRCGLGRAKQEYARMVMGCKTLSEKFPLYFITITCKGREESWQDAEQQYGQRTNRLLDASRAQWKRANKEWHYVQVTERQARKHPHSHFITTFCPPITTRTIVRKKKRQESGQYKVELSTHVRSNWFENALCKAGLGYQYDISEVKSADGASRYVAKYLFKPTIFTADWPKGWKRIRYSQGFPKAPEIETDAIALITHADWYALAQKAVVVTVANLDDYDQAKKHLWYHDTIVRLKTK